MSQTNKNPDAKYTPRQITGPSKAVQSPKDEVNINNIVAKFQKTGVLGTGTGTRKPIFGEFNYFDFQAMQNAIIDVEQQFMSLPSKIRNRFKNDPAQLIRFTDDPANLKEATKMGLLEALVPELFQPDTKTPPAAPEATKPPENPPKDAPKGA